MVYTNGVRAAQAPTHIIGSAILSFIEIKNTVEIKETQNMVQIYENSIQVNPKQVIYVFQFPKLKCI